MKPRVITAVAVDEYHIRGGYIKSATDFPNAKSLSEGERRIPILTASIERKYWKFDSAQSTSFGTGTIDVGDIRLLTLRYQFGANQVYWVADPHSPGVWAMLDKWSEARLGFISLEPTDGSPLALLRLSQDGNPFRVKQSATCGKQANCMELVDAACQLIRSNRLAASATSDIADVPRIRRCEVMLLASPSIDRGFAELNDADQRKRKALRAATAYPVGHVIH